MGADERQPAVAWGGAQHRDHGFVKPLQAMERRRRPGALGDPGGMLEHAAKGGDERVAAHFRQRRGGNALTDRLNLRSPNSA